MTAADASIETVTVEVSSHAQKEPEDLLIDLTSTDSGAVEDVAAITSSVTLEDANVTSNEPASVFGESQVTEKMPEEAKDDKEEQQEGVEQRIPADIATQRKMEQDKEIKTATKEVIEPMRMLRKGATAVVGGTVTVVGLIMIPLPTPMGCVVASSGMAILGSEFEGAKEMNERMIKSGKEGLQKVRDKAIEKIESMNSNDDHTDADDDSVDDGEEAPEWLKNMNEAERKRQRKLMKQKYREENKETHEQIQEFLAKKTGSFLSRNILPALHRTREWGKEEKPTENGEGAPENANPLTSLAPSSETIRKGKEQMRASFNSTSLSFSSMFKRMSPQKQAEERTMDIEEVISFDENEEAKAPAFKDDAPATVTATISGAADPATASVMTV